MKKIYLIYAYVTKDEYENIIKYLTPEPYDFRFESGLFKGLYAWTDSKDILNEFVNVRNEKLYDIVEVEFDDKDEFKSFKFDKKIMKLEVRDFHNSSQDFKSTIKIVATLNEQLQSVDYGSENMMEFAFYNNEFINYNIFKDSLIEALDLINYTTEYDIRHNRDDDVKEYADYNMSYGITTLGNKLRFDTMNEVNIFLHLFKYFFTGEIKEKHLRG